MSRGYGTNGPATPTRCGARLGDGGSLMERMGSLDAVFIAVEDAVNHMHIGSVGIFEGPVPSYEEVRALVAGQAPARAAVSPAGAGGAGEHRPALVDRRRSLRSRLPPATHRAAAGRPVRARAARRACDVAAPRSPPAVVGDVAHRGSRRRSLGDAVEGAPLHGRRHRGQRPARRRHGSRARRAAPRCPTTGARRRSRHASSSLATRST